MTVNPHSYAELNAALKDNYLKFAAVLQHPNSELLKMCKEDSAFEMTAGGKNMTFSVLMDRPHNYGPAAEDGFFPGMSSLTNDDIDTLDPQNAVIPRKFINASTAVTLRQLTNVDKPFEQFKKWNLGFHMDQMKEDFESYQERQLLGDGTDVLGVVASVSTDLTNTTIVLQPATTVSSHGVHGTQRLNKNQKVAFIVGADWATSRRTARIHANLGALGREVFKVLSVSATADVSATPSIVVGGDLVTAGTALQAGAIVVQARSRTSNATGGNASDDSGLLALDGIYSYVDDGTLRSTLYGLTRATYPDLDSEVDLVADAAATRPLTWRMMQTMSDRLRRRAGNKGLDEMDYMLLTERSVKTGYVHDEGEASKRYIQEEKMKKLMPGFKDVGVAFLGNDKAIPWITMNTVPFGHALFLRKSQLKAMWDRKPGIVDDDGLTLRQVAGKPVFSSHLAGYGNFVVLEPWTQGRINGLSGVFSATT